MDIIIQRAWYDEKCIEGDLLVDGTHFCYSLEPPLSGCPHPAVHEGRYELTIRWSPRFQRLMPHVENVPGRSGILIHWGDFPKDTEGCCLVAYARGNDRLMASSRVCFDDLFGKMMNSDVLSNSEIKKVGMITYEKYH